MAKSSQVRGSKSKSYILSNAEAARVLGPIFKTSLSTNAKAATQLATSGLPALCDAYSKGVTTQQIADYLQCTLHAVICYESALKAEDKELLNQAKLQHAQLAKNTVAARMDRELDRLEVARELTETQVGSGIATTEDREAVGAALGSEDLLADIVLKKLRALKIRADLADNDINRYSKRLDEGKTDTAVTVYNTLVVADRGQIPPMPTISQRLLPEE